MTDMVTTVTVEGQAYNVAQAPAIAQKRLLLLVGARIALRSAQSREEIDTDLLTGTLLTFSEQEFDQIAGIVLPYTYASGGQSPVTVQDFTGKMLTLWMLVAEAIKVNLSDFFTWLDKKHATEKGEKMQTSRV